MIELDGEMRPIEEVEYEIDFLTKAIEHQRGKTQEELRQEQRDILFGRNDGDEARL